MSAASFPEHLLSLKLEFNQELIAIADWWAANTVDHEQGGFYVEVDANNVPQKNASKGVILNTRILWFFSEAAIAVENPRYRECATRAYEYLMTYFHDKDYGGFYWELDALGQPIVDKKQVYAQGFAIYSLSAYYKLTGDEAVLAQALDCFERVEKYTIDREREGYLEAFTREWGAIDDLRLSEKDLNYPKSQNTHLHVLEAYTELHNVCPRADVKAALKYNIDLFDHYMIDKTTHHLRMFLDYDWKDFSPGLTYGHDIEASWLIAKALKSLGDDEYLARLTPTVIKIAEVTFNEAIGEHGHVIDAYHYATKHYHPDIVWWVQAEAVVGFLNAYVTTKDKKYLTTAENIWAFIKAHLIDHEQGEWWWFSNLDAPQATPCYKVGFWKCPYHNGRAMLEASRYIDKILAQ